MTAIVLIQKINESSVDYPCILPAFVPAFIPFPTAFRDCESIAVSVKTPVIDYSA